MAERVSEVAEALEDLDEAVTAAQLAPEAGLSVSSTLAVLLLMERRGTARRAGVAANGGQLWRLAR